MYFPTTPFLTPPPPLSVKLDNLPFFLILRNLQCIPPLFGRGGGEGGGGMVEDFAEMGEDAGGWWGEGEEGASRTKGRTRRPHPGD